MNSELIIKNVVAADNAAYFSGSKILEVVKKLENMSKEEILTALTHSKGEGLSTAIKKNWVVTTLKSKSKFYFSPKGLTAIYIFAGYDKTVETKSTEPVNLYVLWDGKDFSAAF